MVSATVRRSYLISYTRNICSLYYIHHNYFILNFSSKLASLFDSRTLPDDLNGSLTYTAPKQPKAKKEIDLNEPHNKPQTSVLLIRFVSLWKLLEDKSYKALGKHGLVLIGSPSVKLYEIIAYKERNKVVVRRNVKSNFKLFNQKDNFSTFNDNDDQNWLVKFENVSDQNSFSEEAGKYGANIVNNTKEIVETKERDPAPMLAESIPKDVTIKAEILPRLKKADEKSDSSSSKTKANILSRMARMGQQILPNQLLYHTSTDVSDSDLEDSNIDRKIPPRKFKRTSHTDKSNNREQPVPCPEKQMVPTQVNYSNSPVALPQMAPVLYSQPVPYDGFNQYIVAQNAELKINLANISSKLDSVLSGGITSNTNSDDKLLKSKIKALELKSENLQAELQKFHEEYSNLEKKYNDLIKQNIENSGKDNKDTVIENLNEKIAQIRLDQKAREEEIDKYKYLDEMTTEKFKNIITELEKKIEAQALRLQPLAKFYEENKDNANLHATIDNLQENVAKLTQFEEYYNRTESEKRHFAKENVRIKNTFTDKLKEHMTNMYQSIVSDIDENTSGDNLKLRTAQYLKGAAFQIIEDFENTLQK